MDEAAVDRAVGGLGPSTQDVEVFQRAGERFGPGSPERFRPFVRAGEAEHLVAGGNEFGDDGGADEAGRAGQEYTHKFWLDSGC